MPRIIRRALYQKIRDLPAMREFQRDFQRISGVALEFLEKLGLGECGVALPPLCAALHACDAGRVMCGRFRQALLVAAEKQPAHAVCDAGLVEVAVPLNISGIHAGFLVFRGIRNGPADRSAWPKAKHLLGRLGIGITEEEFTAALAAGPVCDAGVIEAYRRIVEMGARLIAMKVTDQWSASENAMPEAVTRACGFIRARALADDINLPLVARHCGVSQGHLSRLFHHATGLTFREYLAQVRIEHARALLLRTNRTVTEIAFESGFQSLSQFHRVFLRAFGQPPGKVRRAHRSAE